MTRSSSEGKPPGRGDLSTRTWIEQARTPRVSTEQPESAAHDQQAALDNNMEEEDVEEEESSPSGTTTKKQRKRPHYLSHEDRCQIIERIAGGEQQAALAREFGVTRAAVCHIQKHRFEILARPVAGQTGDEDASTRGPSRDQSLVHELRTPSVLALLTTLRDRRTDAVAFRRAAGRVIMILIEDVLGRLDARSVEIRTMSGQLTTGIERRHEVCGVKLGDEGYPFSVLFHQIEVNAAEGFVNLDTVRDRSGRRAWRLDRMDLPANIASCKILLFTATCGDGERECKAIEALCGVNALEKDMTLVTIVCASDGVAAICSRFPQVRIVTGAIDRCIDPVSEAIVPGIGDFVARYNDEEAKYY